MRDKLLSLSLSLSLLFLVLCPSISVHPLLPSRFMGNFSRGFYSEFTRKQAWRALAALSENGIFENYQLRDIRAS